MTSQSEVSIDVNQSTTIATDPNPSASQFSPAYGRGFLFVVRCGSAYFEVAAESSATESREKPEQTVRLCINMGPVLKDVFYQLKEKFEADGYEPRFTDTVDISVALSGLAIKEGRQHIHPFQLPTDLALTVEKGRVVFDDLTSPGFAHGFKRLFYTADPNVQSLYPIICAATHFYYRLRRSPSERALLHYVNLDLVQSPWYEYFRSVDKTSPTEADNPAYYVTADEDVDYGIKITNNSEYALYPAVFYFDNSDFSICAQAFYSLLLMKGLTEYHFYYFLDPCYLTERPITGGILPPPLPSGSSLRLGFGENGDGPWVFYLRPGEDLDIGYMKLLLTTKFVDLSHIKQESPFQPQTSRGGERGTGMETLSSARGPERSLRSRSAIWDEMTMILVQTSPMREE